MIQPFVTMLVPCISLKHLTELTTSQLDCGYWDNGKVLKDEATIFLTAPNPEARANYPDDLKAVMDWADKHTTHGWFMLDVDGDVQPDLEVY